VFLDRGPKKSESGADRPAPRMLQELPGTELLTEHS